MATFAQTWEQKMAKFVQEGAQMVSALKEKHKK